MEFLYNQRFETIELEANNDWLHVKLNRPKSKNALSSIMITELINLISLAKTQQFLRGIFISWSTLFVIFIVIDLELISFTILSGFAALINLLSLFTLVDLIKEERNTLTDKEIYLLQKLAKKK